jgi:hypothetical protein
MQELMDDLADDPTFSDPVDHPYHYTSGGIETIDYIEAKDFNYHLGNAVKYISRAGRKLDAIEDLRKAKWYLDREIMRLERTK